MSVTDLNSTVGNCHPPSIFGLPGIVVHVHGQSHFLSSYGAFADAHRPQTLRGRRLRCRTQQHRLCSRCDHRRSLSVGVFLGRFRSTEGAIKLRTLMDLHGSIPTFIHVSDGKLHDVNFLDLLLLEAGAF